MCNIYEYIDGLVQERRNSIAKVLKYWSSVSLARTLRYIIYIIYIIADEE